MNESKEELMNLAEKINQEGIRQLGLSDIGRLLGMTDDQVLYAKNRGKLRTRKVFVPPSIGVPLTEGVHAH